MERPGQYQMKKIGETAEHEIFAGYFEGRQVRFYRVNKTREVLINADDCAKVLGFTDAQTMLEQDSVLDILNQQAKVTGVFPIQSVSN